MREGDYERWGRKIDTFLQPILEKSTTHLAGE